MFILTAFFAVCSISFAHGFLPSNEVTDGRPDYTHASITQAAIYKVTSDVISNVISPGRYNASDPDTTIRTYFDRDGLLHFAQTVMDIVNKNNLAQRLYADRAIRSMNCEKIESGHMLLQSLRDNVINQAKFANPNWNYVRDMVGQYLFTMQEFYSNTNWVEMFGVRVCEELGISGKSLLVHVSNPNVVTCVSCNHTKDAVQAYSCVDNMRSDGFILTSGYTSYQECRKPIGQFPPNMGKCSHGGPYDSSKDIPATGGINKETSNPELSPHFDLHQQAGQAAIKATYDFFVKNGTGLFSTLGIENFKQLLGMNYKNPCYDCLAPGLSVVFVINNRASMRGEIKAISQISNDIVNSVNLGSNGTINFILSTFSDPDTTIRKTSNGDEFKRWMHNLTVHGGGDCQDIVLTAIINALTIANPGSCIFIAADTEPKDSQRQDEVVRLINAKKFKLVFLLRGGCNRRRRRSHFTFSNPQCIPNNIKRLGRIPRWSVGFLPHML